MKNLKKKILVGMSGGVDSSVAALLLKKTGFDVAGGYMKCWDHSSVECTGSDDERSARLAASHIRIPFYIFDFRKEYKNKVFDYFLKEQKAGRTPNPDIMCNLHIKFGLFFDRASSLGFDYMATGHYVKKCANRLRIAKDKQKDQSYFLALIRPNVLDRVVFPLGEYTKKEVRKIAQKAGLPNAKRKDSQGLCFVGEVKMESFLKEYLGPKPGLIVEKSGKTIGSHQGIWFFTIGQRKGIGLSGGPYFVWRKDLKNNLLIVTKNENDLFEKELTAKNVNWLSGSAPKLPLRVKVKIRYRTKPAPALLTKTPKGLLPHVLIKFDKPQRAITPGQSVVFYQRAELLGGGVIV